MFHVLLAAILAAAMPTAMPGGHMTGHHVANCQHMTGQHMTGHMNPKQTAMNKGTNCNKMHDSMHGPKPTSTP